MKILKKSIILGLFTFALLNTTGCKEKTKTEKEEDTGNTVEATAPDAVVEKQQGYALDGLEHGFAQSPVNIITNNVNDVSTHKVALNYESSKEVVKNLGHTVQVNYDPGNTISFDDKIFDFKQFHFHTPSEHLIDGMTFPMEMHMVHTLQGQKDGDTPVYLVIGLLFREGAENPFLNEFMAAIPDTEGEESAPDGKAVNVNNLLTQAGALEYYNYQGSLTTPPYTETVTWLLAKHIFEASPDQIQRFNKLEGNNARHVQALYGRKVLEQ
ncbi:carbonic anhydrase [Flagellimonas sp. CMM7]|uniref:carbonic anhydrase n=1 Tax=Flagellimonas sp. CMM7 TaxID=2654676 RepID=UPI0013D1E45E|nr:carbonic anhydrase family protein [Flagellimonas sp. CMM7]UII80331.1 carbonic anhydrase family protein [Flagellimonas sp. CMM7]